MSKNKKIIFFAFFLGVVGVISSVSAADIVYEAGGRRDPFNKSAGLAAAGSLAPGLSGYLEGIIYDPVKHSYAVFGGKTYRVGERVGDATVLKIEKDSVLIRVNNEERTLRIRD
ncbi:MAG: hypothetical protein KTQ49_02400 [Candidatus Omnitrophica bacterium]|nr:hypothetical protein [Candidatus Omnitrophota bacterium]